MVGLLGDDLLGSTFLDDGEMQSVAGSYSSVSKEETDGGESVVSYYNLKIINGLNE